MSAILKSETISRANTNSVPLSNKILNKYHCKYAEQKRDSTSQDLDRQDCSQAGNSPAKK